MVDIHVVPAPPIVKQSDEYFCWAAVTAMVFGWRTGVEVTESEAVAQLGPPFTTMYASGDPLIFGEVGNWARAAGLQPLPPSNISVAILNIELTANRPLVVGKLDSNGMAHMVLVVGLKGDESPAGTEVVFLDADGGVTRTQDFAGFAHDFEGVDLPPQAFRVL